MSAGWRRAWRLAIGSGAGVATLAVFAATGLLLAAGRGSEPWRSNLRFSHRMHVLQGMVCEQCHRFAFNDDDRRRDRVVPRAHDACVACHRRQIGAAAAGPGTVPTGPEPGRSRLATHPHGWLPLPAADGEAAEIGGGWRVASGSRAGPVRGVRPGECGLCHLDQPPGPTVRRRVRVREEVNFSHAAHGGKIVCLDCHGAVPAWDNLEGSAVEVTMASCLRCHDNLQARRQCQTCHPVPLRPADHPRGFERKHGTAWRMHPGRCHLCHEDSYCLDCHSRRPRSHTVGFIRRRHGLNARTDPDRCAACHGERPGDVCGRCHADR